MILKLEIYNNTKTYYFPDMSIATPEIVAEKYPIVNVTNLKPVIQTDKSRIMFYTAPEPIQVTRSRYDIDSSLSDEEALVAIEDIINVQQVSTAESAPSPQERIAAALEYQNLLSM